MTISSIFNFTKSSSPIKTILWSGLVAGVLDAVAGVIVYFIFFKFNPFQVLQFIATGIHGAEAMNGGITMIIAGTIYHFIIAYACAIVYFFLYPRLAFLRTNITLMGLIFGLGIWLVMNLIVIPLSNVPESPFDINLTIIGMVWHMTLVGLPIALITAKYFSKEERQN